MGVSAQTRRCIVTGEVCERSRLVRFVVAPDGAVVPDVAGDLPGRGIWVSASREVIEKACAKRLFARAARREVAVAADLAERTETLLARRCLDLLGLARRAGVAVTGFEKVRALLRAERAAALIAASDGAADGRAKLRRLTGDLPLVESFTGTELSLALGRENVVHAALASGRLAERFVMEAGRLARFRGVEAAGSEFAAEHR